MLVRTCRAFLLCLSLIDTNVGHAQTGLQKLSSDLAQKFTTGDTLFREPYIDADEWRDKPVRHRYVHGGFKGTDARFSFYFPSKEQYQGRFSNTSPLFPTVRRCRRELPARKTKLVFPLRTAPISLKRMVADALTSPNRSPATLPSGHSA